MRNKFPLMLLLIASLTLSISCGDDESSDDEGPNVRNIDCTNFLAGNWTSYDDVDEVFEDYVEALTAYSNDPSASNCNELEDALDDYFDVLGDIWSECYGELGEDWDEYVEETDLDC